MSELKLVTQAKK